MGRRMLCLALSVVLLCGTVLFAAASRSACWRRYSSYSACCAASSSCSAWAIRAVTSDERLAV